MIWRALRQRLRQQHEQRALTRRAIPDTLWNDTLQAWPFLAWRSVDDLAELRRLSSLFLDAKEFSTAQDLDLSDAMAVAIAAQACLPVLRFGLAPYDGFVGIVVHPDEVTVRREWVDQDGIAHEADEVLAGEAVPGGPVMLSWRDVQQAGSEATAGYNVVVHEFVHVLDLGEGMPSVLPAADRGTWHAALGREFDAHVQRVDAGWKTLLDPYGAMNLQEFMAVASEVFFVAPQDLRLWHPELYALLQQLYRQDTAAG